MADKLLINENKSNNSDFKSNNFDVKSNEELFKQALVEGVNRRFDREIEEAKKIEQIEEMAKILCGMKNGCDGCMWDKVHCNERNYAEEIYNAGYRKKSEGHWFILEYEYFTCSECGYYHHNGCDSTKEAKEKLAEGDVPKYCSECGAKMKGGEQE